MEPAIQTFLTHESHADTARCLDNPRLGKQRVEVLQILNVLHEICTGYGNHPAVKMWRGHEWQLAQYGLDICRVWLDRGYKDTCYGKILEHARWSEAGTWDMPAWWLDVNMRWEVIASHRSNLIRKDPSHYGPHFPGVTPDLEYVWPVP